MQSEILLSVISWLLGIVGSLLLCGGGLIVYIFRQHTTDNARRFSENREDHQEFFKELRKKEDKR